MNNLRHRSTRAARRITALLLAIAAAVSLLPLSGCSGGGWEGEWNRTGDSTFARAEMSIYNVKAGGFTFDITLYNGNIAGELTGMTASFTDSSKTSARCSIPQDPRAYITFGMDEYGALDVVYGYEIPRSDPEQSLDSIYGNQLPDDDLLGITETEMFGFSAEAHLTGHYVKGEVTYINQTLYDAGILSRDENERIESLMTDASYMRLLDCFQTWRISNGNDNSVGYEEHDRKNNHEDEIGGYVYYGSNTMQEYAAIFIIYDDGTASVVVTFTDSTPVYYSSNAIYKDGSLTPLPIKEWLEDYNDEQKKLAAQ